jgi:cell division septum initiation protein DivIVA
MALDLRVAVNKAIVGLRREISKKSSELTSLRKELARYQKVHDVLNGQSSAARSKANRTVRRKRLDWGSVLKRLPSSFAVGNVNNLANRKSTTYAHRMLGKWVKQRKIKRVERGRYEKL